LPYGRGGWRVGRVRMSLGHIPLLSMYHDSFVLSPPHHLELKTAMVKGGSKGKKERGRKMKKEMEKRMVVGGVLDRTRL